MIKLRPQHETKLQISREVRDFGEFVRVENSYDYRLLQKNSRDVMVGVERKKHLPKNETIPTKTLFHINALDASIFI